MVETNRSSLPKCSRGSASAHHRNNLMTKAQQGGSSTGTGGSLSGPPVPLHTRRRRHKTVHFGENLLMQVCANRAHLAALGPRLPDINFCHEARNARVPGARYCCLAHHCCLAQSSLPSLPTSIPHTTQIIQTSQPQPSHRSRHHHRSTSRSDSQSHSSGAESLEKKDKDKKPLKVMTHTKKVPHGSCHHRLHACPMHPVSDVSNALVPVKGSQAAKKTSANISPYLCFPSKLEPNVQQLFSFIESVLSAWAAEEGLTSTGEYSEPDERDVNRKKIKKYKMRTNILNIRRIVYDVSILQGSKLLGNVKYRHTHWKRTAQSCNELFLRKVRIFIYRHFMCS
jgi:hypothetical protein